MGFIDDLKGSIVSTTNDLGKMAQTAGDVTKISYDKKVKEGELIKLYEKLGRKYYEAHKNDDDDDIKEITATILRIQELADQVLEKKGGKACPKCGTLVKSGSAFCPSCGEKMDDLFEE